ncbi:MAG: hypothetical protein ACD_28C00192G0007 [uncultured bacterium]|nr:MAG: hypothetical protein ACD_28C00192G0007 [uncultured bacterium]
MPWCRYGIFISTKQGRYLNTITFYFIPIILLVYFGINERVEIRGLDIETVVKIVPLAVKTGGEFEFFDFLRIEKVIARFLMFQGSVPFDKPHVKIHALCRNDRVFRFLNQVFGVNHPPVHVELCSR